MVRRLRKDNRLVNDGARSMLQLAWYYVNRNNTTSSVTNQLGYIPQDKTYFLKNSTET
jgi:hypothetical protein